MYSKTNPEKQEANARFLTDAFAYMTEHIPPYREFDYFQETIKRRLTESIPCSRHPIVILGTAVPDELVYACDENPYWILGGDPGMVQLSDDAVPRDTDPVSRSALGIIRSLPESYLERAMFIIPLINDSNRKLTGILKAEGRKICTLDVPPLKTSDSEKLWLRQVEKLSDALEKHTGKSITKRALEKAQRTVSHARREMSIFSKIALQNIGIVSGTWRMLVMQSYYYANDLDEWTAQLAALSAKIRTAVSDSQPHESCVLLMGSPIYFPNYKIPFLIEEAGMKIAMQLDYTSQRIRLDKQNPKADLSQIANCFFQKDASTAYPQNDALFDAAVRVFSRNHIDGVVYHVLKGQIEYDFELERLEKLFSEHSIPVCRLETDYSYQDIEQLRIRVDAFREVLAHRNQRKEAYAV